MTRYPGPLLNFWADPGPFLTWECPICDARTQWPRAHECQEETVVTMESWTAEERERYEGSKGHAVPSGGSGVTKECDHRYIYMGEEKQPDVPGRRYILDIFFCERCLNKIRKKSRLEVESRERFGWDVVERY